MCRYCNITPTCLLQRQAYCAVHATQREQMRVFMRARVCLCVYYLPMCLPVSTGWPKKGSTIASGLRDFV